MAEHDDEPEVRRRFRELPREEPPPALDAAIRAEARRAVESHPAPLVAPTGRRRWYFPVAAAAVIMLAVAVTSQVEREQVEPALPRQAAAPAPEVEKERKFAETPPAAKPAAPPPASAEERKNQAPAQSATGALSSREDAFGQRDRASRERNPERQERPSSGVASAPAPQRQVQRDEAREQSAEPQAMAKLAQEPPEKWLERIARLRQEGRHDEADKALAEFRKAYPDYRIPEAMLEKVEKK